MAGTRAPSPAFSEKLLVPRQGQVPGSAPGRIGLWNRPRPLPGRGEAEPAVFGHPDVHVAAVQRRHGDVARVLALLFVGLADHGQPGQFADAAPTAVNSDHAAGSDGRFACGGAQDDGGTGLVLVKTDRFSAELHASAELLEPLPQRVLGIELADPQPIGIGRATRLGGPVAWPDTA